MNGGIKCHKNTRDEGCVISILYLHWLDMHGKFENVYNIDNHDNIVLHITFISFLQKTKLIEMFYFVFITWHVVYTTVSSYTIPIQHMLTVFIYKHKLESYVMYVNQIIIICLPWYVNTNTHHTIISIWISNCLKLWHTVFKITHRRTTIWTRVNIDVLYIMSQLCNTCRSTFKHMCCFVWSQHITNIYIKRIEDNYKI